MAFDWYPFNPVAFKRDTYHLCAAADGIYRRLIDEYMQTQLPLPDNDAALAGIARVSLAEFNQYRAEIRAFFRSENGKLKNKRCDIELNAQRMRQEERSRIGKEAATIRWAREKQNQQRRYVPHALPNANAMRPDATLHLSKKERGETEKELSPSPFLTQTIKGKGWVA